MGAVAGHQALDPSHSTLSIVEKVRGTTTLHARHHAEAQRRGPIRFRTVAQRNRSDEEFSKSIRLLDSFEVHDADSPSRVAQISETFSSYDDRLQVLEEQARLDGYSLNDASRKAFSEFCLRYPLMRRARLVLMENGNLRATWKDDYGAHVGLQFQDSRSIQFVIFGRRALDRPVQRVTGRVTMDGIMRQIKALDVRGAVTYGP